MATNATWVRSPLSDGNGLQDGSASSMITDIMQLTFTQPVNSCPFDPTFCPCGFTLELWLKIDNFTAASTINPNLVKVPNQTYKIYRKSNIIAITVYNGTHYWWSSFEMQEGMWHHLQLKWLQPDGMIGLKDGKVVAHDAQPAEKNRLVPEAAFVIRSTPLMKVDQVSIWTTAQPDRCLENPSLI